MLLINRLKALNEKMRLIPAAFLDRDCRLGYTYSAKEIMKK